MSFHSKTLSLYVLFKSKSFLSIFLSPSLLSENSYTIQANTEILKMQATKLLCIVFPFHVPFFYCFRAINLNVISNLEIILSNCFVHKTILKGFLVRRIS